MALEDQQQENDEEVRPNVPTYWPKNAGNFQSSMELVPRKFLRKARKGLAFCSLIRLARS